MKQYNNKKLYKYVITVDAERYPRKMAEDLVNVGRLSGNLISVTDLQNDKHIYGATWQAGVPLMEQVIPENLKRLREEMGIE